MTSTTSTIGKDQGELHVLDRRADGQRPVHHHIDVDGWRDRRFQMRQRGLDTFHGVDDVGARLFEDDQQDALLAVLPGAQILILWPVDRLADIAHPYRCPIAPGQNDIIVLRGLRKLIVVVNRERLTLRVDSALRRIDGGIDQHAAHVLQGQAHVGKLAGINLHPHGTFLLAADQHLGYAGDLRHLLRQHDIGVVVDRDQRHLVGLDRQDQDRRIGRVDLAIGRARRQVLGQLRAGGIDSRLHIAGRRVDVTVQVELQRDTRLAEHVDRGELCHARYLGELPFQRLRHRGGHDFRAGTGIAGADRDRRELDARQRRHRQEWVCGEADQNQGRRQQRCRDRTADKGGGHAHWFDSPPRCGQPPDFTGAAGVVCASRTVTCAPFCNLD